MSIPFGERGGPARGLLDLATGCYPAFLFGGALGDLLPVFHFHDVTHEWLEPRLRYLAENGYRTVACDDIERLVVDRRSPGPRAVALTFDDAWASAWSVATPLLKEFGLQAILFAIPSRVSDPERRFVTWDELKAMHTSGAFDVQSHTRSHATIFSSRTLTGFVSPDYAREPVLERPLTAEDQCGVRFVEPAALGTPLYERRSRMSDARRFVPDAGVGDRCRAHVRENGGAAFFSRPGWRAELDAIAHADGGSFESDDARSAFIRDELADARAILNERLGTNTVRHVALPWGIAGATAKAEAAATGYATAFAERPLKRRAVKAGDDRYQLMRLNGKFLTCLPGRGRSWFFATV
jgi:hypothetical protein